MKNSFVLDAAKRQSSDLLILPFWQGGHLAASFPFYEEEVAAVLQTQDFKAKEGENTILYVTKEKEPRLLLLGLGEQEKITAETLRRAYANALTTAKAKEVKKVSLLFPKIESLGKEVTLKAIAEGIFLTNYAFSRYKSEKKGSLIEHLEWIGLEEEKKILDEVFYITSAIHFTRDLVNEVSEVMTPEKLKDVAVSMGKKESSLKVKVFDKASLTKMGMGLILAVSQGSVRDPYLVEIEYRGDPSSNEKTVLVGKGITYDTGGLSLKPTDAMLAMKCDMAGAATVLGTLDALSQLKWKKNVTGLIPLSENTIGSKSYRLGDVYTSYAGKTVEVNNTDAEGRLVLADALAYAAKNLQPTCILDLATLTGAIVIALGEEIAGFFANDEAVAKRLEKASQVTDELLCRMPLHLEYFEPFRSDLADLYNNGGRDAGSMKAALFLREFVGKVPWAHLDIAGTAYWSKPKFYNPTKATGYGIRLLLSFLAL